MTELFWIFASFEDLIRCSAINIVLVKELVNTLRVEEVLDGVTILLLPLLIRARPAIVERDVHRNAPRVIAEGIAENLTVLEQ